MSDGVPRTTDGVFGGLEAFDDTPVDADVMDRMFLSLGASAPDAPEWQLDALGTDPDFYSSSSVPQLALQYIDTDPPATSAPPPTPSVPNPTEIPAPNSFSTPHLLQVPLTAVAAEAALAASTSPPSASPSASPSTSRPTVPVNATTPRPSPSNMPSTPCSLPTSTTTMPRVSLSTPPRSPNAPTTTTAQHYAYHNQQRRNHSKRLASVNASKTARHSPRASKTLVKPSQNRTNQHNNNNTNNNILNNANRSRSPISSGSSGRPRRGTAATITTVTCSSCRKTVSGTSIQLRRHVRLCKKLQQKQQQQSENMSMDRMQQNPASPVQPSEGAHSDGTHSQGTRSQPSTSPHTVPTNGTQLQHQQQTHQYQNYPQFQQQQQQQQLHVPFTQLQPSMSAGDANNAAVAAVAAVAATSASASGLTGGISRRDADLLSVVRRLETSVNTLDINARLCLRDALVSLSNKASNPSVPPTPQQEAMNRAAEYLVLRMLFLSGHQVMHTPPGTGAGYAETPVVTASPFPNQQQHHQLMDTGGLESSPNGGIMRSDDGTVAASTGTQNVSVAQPDEDMIDRVLQSTEIGAGNGEEKVADGT